MYQNEVLEAANDRARSGDVEGMYTELRALPLADFCMLHLHSAPPQFSDLMKSLPKMPAPDVQMKWVGDSGASLMARSCSLARLFDHISWRTTGSGLAGKRIIDYGCGWGRLLRIMNYYSAPSCVFGVDAMQKSLDLCVASGVPNKTALVPARPSNPQLPFGGEFDFAYLFSVFSHTPQEVTTAVLQFLGRMCRSDAVIFATIRTADWLKMREGTWPERLVSEMFRAYNERGYAFVPLNGDTEALAEADYGDTIMTPAYFATLAAYAGWKIAAVDRDVLEPFQLGIALKRA